jgi:hypothetical protein
MPVDQEHQVTVLDDRGDLLAVGLGGLAAEVGIAAGPKAAGDAHADQHLVLDRGTGKRLRVGVDHRQLQPLEILHLEPVHGVGAGATDADQLDRDVAVGEQLVLEGKFVEIHGAQELAKKRVTYR